MNYIQIGASNGLSHAKPDGFFTYIQSKEISKDDRIILVEPNSLLIPDLKENWSDYSENIEIYEYGIVPKELSGKLLKLFWHPKNAPHHELSSFNPYHIIKHHQEWAIEDLSIMNVPSITLEYLIENTVKNEPIEMLALDIEGIDAEVLLDIDFSCLNVHYLSFEAIHLGIHKEKILSRLREENFSYVGKGLDPHGYDLMFIKEN